MVTGFEIGHLGVPPALNSLHSVREAIDMRIWWTGNLNIYDDSGTLVTINTVPRSGMNPQLKQVGLSYGVKKYVGGNADRPHWSTTGH
jgi:hypothetical protein